MLWRLSAALVAKHSARLCLKVQFPFLETSNERTMSVETNELT